MIKILSKSNYRNLVELLEESATLIQLYDCQVNNLVQQAQDYNEYCISLKRLNRVLKDEIKDMQEENKRLLKCYDKRVKKDDQGRLRNYDGTFAKSLQDSADAETANDALGQLEKAPDC